MLPELTGRGMREYAIGSMTKRAISDFTGNVPGNSELRHMRNKVLSEAEHAVSNMANEYVTNLPAALLRQVLGELSSKQQDTLITGVTQFALALMLAYGLISTLGAGCVGTTVQLIAIRSGRVGGTATLAAQTKLQLIGAWLTPLRIGGALLLAPNYFRIALALQCLLPIRHPGRKRVLAFLLLFAGNGLAGLTVASLGMQMVR